MKPEPLTWVDHVLFWGLLAIVSVAAGATISLAVDTIKVLWQ